MLSFSEPEIPHRSLAISSNRIISGEGYDIQDSHFQSQGIQLDRKVELPV